MNQKKLEKFTEDLKEEHDNLKKKKEKKKKMNLRYINENKT